MNNKEYKQDIKSTTNSITSKNSKGIQTISTHEERKYDTIPFRTDFIKNVLEGGDLQPLLDFDNLATDAFVYPNGYTCIKDDSVNKNLIGGSHFNDSSHDDKSSFDIQPILNKKKYDFYQVINEIGGKLRYIKSGTTGHTFKGIIKVDEETTINYGVKIVAYPKKEKYGDMHDVRRPENAELMMIRLLSYFVLRAQTPHIVLPIGTFYTSITPFVNLIEGNYVDKDNKRYAEFIEKYRKGEYYDTVSVLMSEWANRGDLLDFIKKNYKEFTTLHWKVIFFQIISVIAVIQSKFPGFRHNDLKANNVLIHKISQRGTIFSYTVCKKKYYVPNIGYQVKLWDFDFAAIPGIVENAKVNATWTNEINVKPEQNRYYDIHYFFNTLIKKGFFPELLKDPEISKEIKDFVYRVVPKKFQYGEYVTQRGRIMINDEYLIPNDILMTDPLFEDFRNYKPKKTRNKNSTSENNKKRYIISTE